MKNIDLANKCGSCRNFKPFPGTEHGDCLANPYGDDVAHDPKHPYRQVSRSRIKCVKYWAKTKPQTNADRIRAMSDEELAWELMTWRIETCARLNGAESPYPHTQKSILDWLRQPVKDGDNDVG